MDPDAINPPAPTPKSPGRGRRRARGERPPWSRWKFLAVYWSIQAVFVYLSFPLVFAPDYSDLRWLWRDAYASFTYFTWVAGGLGAGMAAQAVMVMPVPRPGVRAGAEQGTLQLVLAAAVVSFVLVLAAFVVIACLEISLMDRLRQTVRLEWPWSLWVCTAGLTPIVALPFWACYRRGIPVRVNLAIAAFGAAALVTGALWTIYSLRHWVPAVPVKDSSTWFAGMMGLLVLGWAVWTPIVLRFARGKPDETVLSRLASTLLIGSVVEAAAVIPFGVLVRRKNDCYCEEGTFWSLTFCWGVGTLVMGPVVWFIPMSKRRKRSPGGRCECCGYDMSGLRDAERCPECGAGWRDRREQRLPAEGPISEGEPGSRRDRWTGPGAPRS